MWLFATLVMVYTCIAASYRYDAQNLYAFDINLNTAAGAYFLNEEDIRNYLNELKITPGKTQMNKIYLAQLERMIESNGYVRSAEVYIDALSTLHVSVQQRNPVLRIMNSNNVSYYVDESASKMPLHPKFTARVLVAGGHISANDRQTDTLGQKQLNDLVFLTNEILRDDFFARMIEQIWVDENQEIHLVPMIAQQDILLGNAQQIDSKLQNLKAFYLNANPGLLNNYSIINLKFNNQVIATKRNSSTQNINNTQH